MARSAYAFTNFTAGELSPRMDGRTDLEKYFFGCKTLENMVVHPHGSASRRPGTRFVSEAKDSSTAKRLIPFEFSTTQTYMLEFGNLYVRFYKDNGIITETGKTISAITKANPGVVTANSHGYSNGDYVILAGIVGMTELNGRQFKVASVSTNTFALQDTDGNNFNTSALTTYSSAGTAFRIYQITTTYATADLFELKYAQSADVMYITHPTYPIKKLTRTDHTAWSLSTVTLNTGTNFTVSAVTKANPGVVTTSADHGFAAGDFITFRDIGGMTQLVDERVFKVGTVPNATTFQLQDAAGTNVNTSSFGTFSAGGSDVVEKLNNPIIGTAANNFPSCVSFFEQRLVFANTNNNPQTLFFSKSGDYENFTTGTNADDAMIFTIASNQVNAIRYLSAARSLLVGTVGGEFLVTGSDTVDGLSPTNINIRKQSTYGSANKDAISVGNVTLFLQRAKRKVRELVYNYDSDNYVAPDLTILSEHVTESLVKDMAYQQEPDSVLWVAREDGILAGMTYQRTENVVAWHRHVIGGKADTGKLSATDVIGFTSNSTNVSTTNNTITLSSHGLSTGDVVSYFTLTNDIGGLSQGIFYFVIASDSNTIKLATTAANATAGTAISLTSTPSSDTTQYIYKGVNVRNGTFYVDSHGFGNDDYLYYYPSNSSHALGGLSTNTKYYVDVLTDDTFKLSTASDLSSYITISSVNTTAATHKWLTHAKVESVAVIPTDADEDQLYLIVNRFINGATRRYIEYLTPFDYGNSQMDAFYVDSGLTYSGGKTTSVSGLNHLEGEPLDVLVNGAAHVEKTVSSGAVTLSYAAEKATIGLNYESVLQTMRLEAGAEDGTAQGKIKRVHGVTIRLHKTLGCEVGSSLDDMEIIPFRDSSMLMSSAVELFTGDKDAEFRSDYEKSGHIFVRQASPLPLNIIAIYPRLNTFDG